MFLDYKFEVGGKDVGRAVFKRERDKPALGNICPHDGQALHPE